MEVGAARTELSPPTGIPIGGNRTWTMANGVHDPLMAKSVAFEGAGGALAVCVLDLIFVSGGHVAEIRRRVADRCGLSPGSVLVAATHTHNGPPPGPVFYPNLPPQGLDYGAALVEPAAAAVVAAWRDRRPARIGAGSVADTGLTYNRRAEWRAQRSPPDRDDLRYVLANEERPSPVDVDEGRVAEERAATDPEVGVLFAQRDGTPAASLVNVACHTTTVRRPGRYSAGYPAVLAGALRDVFGEDHHSVFANGAAGEIVGTEPPDDPDSGADPGFEKTAHVGGTLADHAVDLWDGVETGVGPVAWTSETLTLSRRRPTDEHVDLARGVLDRHSGRVDEKFVWHAHETLALADQPATHEIEVWAAKIGSVGVVGLPGEIFHELGLTVKRGSPFDRTMVVELANGYCGYVPTREAFARGGYEVTLANSSFLGRDAGAAMASTARSLLESLVP